MKKNDLILIAAILGIAACAWLGIALYQSHSTGQNGLAVVYIDGQKYAEYSLDHDEEIKIELLEGGYNLLVIKDGKADITEASCPDKICVKHRKIDKNGQTIVCLPNKLVVEIKNGEESGLDGIS